MKLSKYWHRFEMDEAMKALHDYKRELSIILKLIREQESRYEYHKKKLEEMS